MKVFKRLLWVELSGASVHTVSCYKTIARDHSLPFADETPEIGRALLWVAHMFLLDLVRRFQNSMVASLHLSRCLMFGRMEPRSLGTDRMEFVFLMLKASDNSMLFPQNDPAFCILWLFLAASGKRS